MAQPLSSERAGNGITSGEFLTYFDKHTDIDQALVEAQETVRSVRRRRKDLRNTMKADGINIAAFDRAYVDEKRSGEEREAEDKRYREFMAWLKKPVGTQSAMDFAPAEPNTHDLHKAETKGLEAGKRGDRADSNSYTPGTESFARYHAGWLRGQALKVQAEVKPPEPAPVTQLRRRGRPAGSRNKTKEDEDASMTQAPSDENGTGTLDDRIAAYAVEKEKRTEALSIAVTARAMDVSEDDAEAAIARLTEAGRLKHFAPGVWILPQVGDHADEPPPAAA